MGKFLMRKNKKVMLGVLIPLGTIAVASAITLPLVLKKNTGSVVDAEDKETVDIINTVISESGKTYNTMSEVVNDTNLQEITTNAENKQFVWDKDANKVVLLNQDNTLYYGPEGYSLPAAKSHLWKMVKSGSTTNTKLFNAKNSDVYAESFSSTSEYSQYLREGFAENSTLTFSSGLDTGNNKKLKLTFENTLASTEPVVINTLVSSLTINSSTSVQHFGNLTELTVSLADTNTKLEEYGSVDAAVILKSGTFDAKKGSDVNSVVVDCEVGEASNVKVNVSENGSIGAIGASNKDVAELLINVENPIVTVSEEAAETDPEIKVDGKTDTPSEADDKFYSGNGTEKSPWCIKTKGQLKLFATTFNNGGFPLAGQDKWYFNLVGDIDFDNEEWTSIGTDSNPFKGIFNGCGFAIKRIKCVSGEPSGTKYQGHVGFFGKIEGTKNSNYDTPIDVETVVDPLTKVWNIDNKELITNNISENNYTTIVKNLTFDNITSIDESKYYVGGIAGAANHVYFGNCKVTSGEIKGWKHVGGIAGTMGGCICQDCTVGDSINSLKITAKEYSAGGITGSTGHSTVVDEWSCFAFVNCSTTDKVIVSLENATGGAIGGLVGDNQSARCCVFDHCTNNASLEVTSSSTSAYVEHVGGIAGFGQNVSVFANCTNNGNISILNDTYAEYIGGITSNTIGIIMINNTNTGTLSGHAVTGMAGIAAGIDANHAQIVNNTNSGDLNNTGGAQSKTEDIYFDSTVNI